ncbi:DUF3999 family protein [Chloroflexota bacterium]
MRNRCLYLVRLFFVAAVLFVLLAPGVAADFSLRDWQYLREITLPSELQREGLVEFSPDSEVFTNSVSGLVDLRIIMGEGTEVPYKLEIGKAGRQQNSFLVSLSDKGYVPGSYTTFTADLGRQGILHNEIEIETPSTDFGRTATVETSDDGDNWVRVADQAIYDFTIKERRFTTRDTRVKYPDSTERYLRVRIADEGGGPLEIAGATAFLVKETLAREVPWPSILGISRDTKRRATIADVDLGMSGLPSNHLVVNASDVNFHREVTLEVSKDQQEWRTILSRASIYSYDTPKFIGKNLDIVYPETTSHYLRLVIHDEDSPPLDIQDIKVWGLKRRLVFTANHQESYKLYYGNIDARRPSYDIEQVFPYLMTEELPEARLGSQDVNPHFVERKPPVSERFPWLFPTVVAVAAILVALILLAIIRQARKVLPPPSE